MYSDGSINFTREVFKHPYNLIALVVGGASSVALSTSFPDLGILSYKIMEKIVQVYVFAWPTRIRDLAEVGFNKFERSYQYFEPNVTDCSTKS